MGHLLKLKNALEKHEVMNARISDSTSVLFRPTTMLMPNLTLGETDYSAVGRNLVFYLFFSFLPFFAAHEEGEGESAPCVHPPLPRGAAIQTVS
jgi:hypothetical protein